METQDEIIQWLEREAKWHFGQFGEGNFMGKGLKKAADALASAEREKAELKQVLADANNFWRHEFETEVAAATEKLFKRLAYRRATRPENKIWLTPDTAACGYCGTYLNKNGICPSCG